VATVFREAGRIDDSDKIVIEKWNDLLERGTTGGFKQSLLWMYGLTEFGYNPIPLLCVWVGISIIAGVLFCLGRSVLRRKDADVACGYTEALLYSTDLMIPIVSIGMRDKFTIDTSRKWGLSLQVLSVLMVVTGWVVTSLLIASIAGLMRLT
jgi:hypothetical protein